MKGELENYTFLNDIKKWGNTNDEIVTGLFWKSFDDSNLDFEKISEKFYTFYEEIDKLLNIKNQDFHKGLSNFHT